MCKAVFKISRLLKCNETVKMKNLQTEGTELEPHFCRLAGSLGGFLKDCYSGFA